MYEVLWSVIELQFGNISFDAEEMAWDFAQCALFTTVVFVVSSCRVLEECVVSPYERFLVGACAYSVARVNISYIIPFATK